MTSKAVQAMDKLDAKYVAYEELWPVNYAIIDPPTGNQLGVFSFINPTMAIASHIKPNKIYDSNRKVFVQSCDIICTNGPIPLDKPHFKVGPMSFVKMS